MPFTDRTTEGVPRPPSTRREGVIGPGGTVEGSVGGGGGSCLVGVVEEDGLVVQRHLVPVELQPQGPRLLREVMVALIECPKEPKAGRRCVPDDAVSAPFGLIQTEEV